MEDGVRGALGREAGMKGGGRGGGGFMERQGEEERREDRVRGALGRAWGGGRRDIGVRGHYGER